MITTMDVIARTDSAVYLRIPKELQRPIDKCQCPYCKAHPEVAPTWDTLVVPVGNSTGYASTVHMPDPVQFSASVKRT